MPRKGKTARGTWKAAERRTAKAFGSERTPLSGGNSKMTRSDTLHKWLYIENKYRSRDAMLTLYADTKMKADKEGKIPVVALHGKNKKGFLVVVHIDDVELVLSQFRKVKNAPAAPTDVEGVSEMSSPQDSSESMLAPWE